MRYDSNKDVTKAIERDKAEDIGRLLSILKSTKFLSEWLDKVSQCEKEYHSVEAATKKIIV